MSKKDVFRVDVLGRLCRHEMSQSGASTLLGVSVRQVRRLSARFSVSASEIVHKGRGRPGPGRTSPEICARVVALRSTKYSMCNDRDFSERLGEDEGIHLGREKVRQTLRAAGLEAKRKRRAGKHRTRREPRAREGELLQWDGSSHDWLSGRGPKLCLMGAVDDATGMLLPGAHFYLHECAQGYLRMLLSVAKMYGLPHAIYGDKCSSLRRNDDYWTLEEEAAGHQSPTHVGLALQTLGIERIDAHSPQAKGRIERSWDTHQDRLVAALTLAGASTLEEANKVLAEYIAKHNKRFKREPKSAEPAWRKVPEHIDLERVCAYRYEVTVDNANTVRLGGKAGVVIDIKPGPGGRSYAKAKVDVYQTLDGAWLVDYDGQCIAKHASTSVADLRCLRNPKKSAVGRARKSTMRKAA